MNKKIYMTTGEFARIMRITKETLFHYDEIGLFQPELTQPNGYRYYSIYQTEILDTILLLKDLGMPLKEIKQQLANRDPAKMLHILEESFFLLVAILHDAMHFQFQMLYKVSMKKQMAHLFSQYEVF